MAGVGMKAVDWPKAHLVYTCQAGSDGSYFRTWANRQIMSGCWYLRAQGAIFRKNVFNIPPFVSGTGNRGVEWLESMFSL